MAVQLRLVDPPPAASPRLPRTSRTTTGVARPAGATRTRTTRARTVKGSTRRAAHWGEWRLDAHTREVGREGIAAARAALRQATEAEPLPRAS